MSNWTHVAAVFRVDGLRGYEKEPDWDKILGKECLFPQHESDARGQWIHTEKAETAFDEDLKAFGKLCKDAAKHPTKYLPMGSEGSLQKSVWRNPDASHIAAYTVTVWGDLRDHESIGEIKEWFDRCCKKLMIRQATCTASNELNGTETWTYRLDEASN